jgi:hypothetical protein
MDHQPTASAEASNVVPLRVAGEGPVPLEDLVEQALRIAMGLMARTTEALADSIGRTLGAPSARETVDEEAADGPGALALIAGAAMGTAVGFAAWSARLATTVVRTGEFALAPVTRSEPFREGVRRIGTRLEGLDARWRDELPRDEEAADAFLRLVVPQVLDATLDQIDLDELVIRRIDLNRVVSGVDLDEVVARVDLDAVVARVDVDRILDRVDLSGIVDRIPLDEILAKVDVDGIVARVDLDKVVDRIDLDAVASRLDVEAVVQRLDLAAIAREVIDELDLSEIIRESMGSMTNETVGGIRVQSMQADRAISRLVDRVLQRRPKDADGPEGPD